MTLIIDENIANVNLILRFMGALEREDYLLCQRIKDNLRKNKLDSNEVDDLKIFIQTCEKITQIDICINTIEMLDNLKD